LHNQHYNVSGLNLNGRHFKVYYGEEDLQIQKERLAVERKERKI
jgi:hypothetical protein